MKKTLFYRKTIISSMVIAMNIVVLSQALVPARLETRTATGLVKGHAYSVTAVGEVKGV